MNMTNAIALYFHIETKLTSTQIHNIRRYENTGKNSVSFE